MSESDRTSDTLAVLRGIGPRALGHALVRRAAAAARQLGRAANVWAQPAIAASSPWFVAALRAAPSALAEEPAVEREPLRQRARAALATTESRPADGDPRLMWEPGRGGRLLRVAAGIAVDPEAPELRRGFDRLLVEWLGVHRVNGASDPLETALRALALWNMVSLAGPKRLSDVAAAATAEALVEHARLVVDRLDDRGLVVGSHLLGELVGLYACGVALRAAGDEPAAWRQLARAGIAAAAEAQVLADGGGAEGSTGYARFVAELFIAALSCARAAGEEPPPGVAGAARAMLEWLAATTAPDGRDVGIGDDDGSRVLLGSRGPRDLAALAPLASWWAGARLEGQGWSEEAGWLSGRPGRERWQAQPPQPWARRFDSAAFGLFLARDRGPGGDMIALRAGPHGQSGAGGHAHNDPLAITIWFNGVPVVIDPGTGLYLGRPALRDRFRGVAAHATVCVDGLEPSPLLATRPFALPDRARARVAAIEDRGGVWSCRAAHEGYRHLGVTHRREVEYDRAAGRVRVVDTLEGSGSRRVAIGFPLAVNDVRVDGGVVDGGGFGLSAGENDGSLAWRVDPGLASPRYGDIVPAVVARRMGRVELPVTVTTIIRVVRPIRGAKT